MTLLERQVQDPYAGLGAVRSRCWTRHASPCSVGVMHEQPDLADALIDGCSAGRDRGVARIQCGTVGALGVASNRLVCPQSAWATTLIVDNPLPDGALALARAICEDYLLKALLANAVGNRR